MMFMARRTHAIGQAVTYVLSTFLQLFLSKEIRASMTEQADVEKLWHT